MSLAPHRHIDVSSRNFFSNYPATSEISTLSFQYFFFFFLNDPPPPDISPLPLPAPLPLPLFLALQRPPKKRAREHPRHAGGRERDKPRGHAPGCQGGRQSGNQRRAGHAAQRSQGGDTPRGTARHPSPGGDETRREGRVGSDLGGPRVGCSGRDGPGRPRPRAEQGGEQGDPAVGQHLTRVAAPAPARGGPSEEAAREGEPRGTPEPPG